MLMPFLIITVMLFLAWPAMIQQQEPKVTPETAAPAPAVPAHAPIPAVDENQLNPVHPTPESQARAKHIYQIDCAICHGEDGGGKGDVAMTAKMLDYRNPASLKDFTDGQIFNIIKNGKGDMPPEDGRATPEETWNLVIYLRSFSKQSGHGSS